MKKLISLIGLSLMLTNVAFAEQLLTCEDLKKIDPVVKDKMMKEREAFEKKLVAKIINRAADEGNLSNFERDMLLSDAKIDIFKRSAEELDQSIKCLKEEIKRIGSH